MQLWSMFEKSISGGRRLHFAALISSLVSAVQRTADSAASTCLGRDSRGSYEGIFVALEGFGPDGPRSSRGTILTTQFPLPPNIRHVRVIVRPPG